MPPTDHVITLVSRAGCHLCDGARVVVARVAGQLGARWEEIDLADSADPIGYSDLVPVILVDGVQLDFWRVSAERLRAALER